MFTGIDLGVSRSRSTVPNLDGAERVDMAIPRGCVFIVGKSWEKDFKADVH